MQRHPFLAALLFAVQAAADGSAVAAQVTPVTKVIHMLEGMLTKGKEEKHREQVQFAAYKQFCDDTTAEKKRLVKEAEEATVMMKAEIQKMTSDSQELSLKITALDADIATWTGDLKAISKVRQIEKADYDAMHKDYSESVDALQRAIAVLKKQAFDRKQPSLAQVKVLKDLKLIPTAAKKAIDNFLQDMQDPDEVDNLAVSAPVAAGYEFQSHGIIDLLERLLDKFIDQRTALEKEEMNSRHSFDLLNQDLNSQIAQATTDRGEKATVKAKALQTKADTEGDLQETSTSKAADEKYLSDLTGTCGQKGADFEARQQLREQELEALSKAVEILGSGAVSGNAEKYLPSSFAQARSLAQLRSRAVSPVQAHVAEFLRQKAESLNSRVLSALATHVADDPFGKVKKLIKDLIVRLMSEANEEASHKGWCDTELSTNEQTRKEKSEAVETLHAEIDELTASLSQLQEDISELSKSVANLDSDMAKATELRQEQKQTNLMTIKDSQDAQAAVAQALVVLKEFYAKAAESTALMQKKGKKHQQEPEIFSGSYKGMQAENGGVIGMLEVIQSDFARLEAETTAEESTAEKEYDEFMTDSKVDKASKQKDIEYKTSKRQDQTQAVTMKSNDLEGTQKELDAALAYYDKLKPSCVDSGASYEDRVVRRKEEIESLQEALRILNGEEMA